MEDKLRFHFEFVLREPEMQNYEIDNELYYNIPGMDQYYFYMIF